MIPRTLRTVSFAFVLASGTAWADSPQCRAVHALKAAQQPGGWSWERGDHRVAQNVSGLVATALAASPEECDASSAVLAYANDCVSRHERGEFLYDPDVEALTAAARISGDTHYLGVAKEAFGRRYSDATGEEIVARWIMLKRGQLIGFDAAAAIRAGVAVGEEGKAVEIAEAVADGGPQWNVGADTNGFLTTSRGALLEALSRLPTLHAEQARVDAFRRTLVEELLRTQSTGGSWNVRNTQCTAYAVRGLLSSGDPTATARAALGVRWLKQSQLTEGSWGTFNDALPEPFVGEVVHEVTAEALLAILR